MTKRITLLLVFVLALGVANADNENDDFVTVRDGRFYIGDHEYRYVGTNLWYGAILASEGKGGNRQRLNKELDDLLALGIDNVRVLVGGDGRDSIPSHIAPKLQTQPGVYDQDLLVGLDYLMAEIEKRNMKVVLYFNNAWEWSGGYGAYLDWVGFKGDGGVGSVLSAEMMGLNLYFRYHTKTEAGNDTVVDGMQRMGATEEVLQNTRIVDDYPDAMTLDEVQQQNCTYMKTPLGLYTELTLPVADIVAGEHYRDSINQVQLSLRRYVPTSGSKDVFPCPQNVLLLRKADMFTFFEKDKLPDSKTSYLTQYNASTNVYQFANIATLVATLKKERDEGAGVMPTDSEEERNRKYAAWETENAEWNKVVLVPVRADYTNSTNIYGISTQTLLRVRNMLGLTSVKLEGGADTPIQVQVVYSRIARK